MSGRSRWAAIDDAQDAEAHDVCADVLEEDAVQADAVVVKVTVPVGVPAPGSMAATVAVKVTAWPKTDGVGRGRHGAWWWRALLTTWLERRRGAGRVVGVAAVDGRDRVGADRRAARC